MDNFNYKKYLAEGKLLKEENENSAIQYYLDQFIKDIEEGGRKGGTEYLNALIEAIKKLRDTIEYYDDKESDKEEVKETLDDVVWDKIEAFRNAVNDDEYVISSLIKAMSTDDANLYLDAIMRDHNFEDGSLDHLEVVPVGDEEEARRKEKEYYTNRGNTSGTIDENVSSKFSEPLG